MKLTQYQLYIVIVFIGTICWSIIGTSAYDPSMCFFGGLCLPFNTNESMLKGYVYRLQCIEAWLHFFVICCLQHIVHEACCCVAII